MATEAEMDANLFIMNGEGRNFDYLTFDNSSDRVKHKFIMVENYRYISTADESKRYLYLMKYDEMKWITYQLNNLDQCKSVAYTKFIIILAHRPDICAVPRRI